MLGSLRQYCWVLHDHAGRMGCVVCLVALLGVRGIPGRCFAGLERAAVLPASFAPLRRCDIPGLLVSDRNA